MMASAQDIDRALTAAFRAVFGWCPAKDDPPSRPFGGSQQAQKIGKRRSAVLRLHQAGASYKAIARQLDITEHTVSRDVVALYRAGRLTERRR